jgi:hypothetical protein
MAEYPKHVEGELQKARRAVAHLDGDLPAQAQGAVDYAVAQLDPSLARLEAALGVKIDGGAFTLGMQAAVNALSGVDMVQLAKTDLGKRMLLRMLEAGRDR